MDQWDRTIDVNPRGVLHGIAAVLPVMRAQGHGHIRPPSASVSSPRRRSTAPPRRLSAPCRTYCDGNTMRSA
ncbi:hypothetical protein ACFQ1S_31950 [Kibdelosporangium lantanae]|uniref:Uncharacterized protein n=1 Tax=Kibdelosporangium lantanae TaxID=1497396 RepID=A0ABW3MGL2_9PSEU